MTSNRRGLAAAIALILVTAIVAADALRAQSVTIPMKAKVKDRVVLSTHAPQNEALALFTVPEGQTFIVTDLLIENSNASSARTQFSFGTMVSVPAGNTFHAGFVTGTQVGGGTVMNVTNLNGTTAVYVEVHGYLLKE